MAQKAGFGVIEFGDTPTVVGELRSWRNTSEAAERDTTIMGSGVQRIQPGSTRYQVECDVYFDGDDAGQALALTQLANETPQALAVYPTGKGTGEWYLSGNAYVMSTNTEGPEGADGSVQMAIGFSFDAAGATWGQAT